MTLDTNFFRKVMGQFATGVTIATTRGQTGPTGLTVNSFASVSLDPPLVLICVDLHSHALPFFRENGFFAVNILTQEQEALSNCFATHSEERYLHFGHAKYHLAATGAPILEDTLGFVDASIVAEYPGGDHVIFLGQVKALGYNGQELFLTDAQKEPSESIGSTNHNHNNGHTDKDQPDQQPLLFFRGRYHQLPNQHTQTHTVQKSTRKNV